jgi:hypothetical protein
VGRHVAVMKPAFGTGRKVAETYSPALF